jgi:hypothetical protein
MGQITVEDGGTMTIVAGGVVTINPNSTLHVNDQTGPGGGVDNDGTIENAGIFYAENEDDVVTGPTGSVTGNALTCFYGFVKVMTKDGEKEIKDLKRGDLVLTNDGYKPLAKLSVTKNPTNLELKLAQKTTSKWMLKIPKHALGHNLPSQDIYTTQTHALSLGKVSEDGDDDFEFTHLFARELLKVDLGCVEENIQEEKYVYNLIFDKHYEVSVGSLRFLSHHPNHNNGNIRLEEGDEFNKEERSKKVYVDEKRVYFKHYSMEQVLAQKSADISDKDFLASLLKF